MSDKVLYCQSVGHLARTSTGIAGSWPATSGGRFRWFRGYAMATYNTKLCSVLTACVEMLCRRFHKTSLWVEFLQNFVRAPTGNWSLRRPRRRYSRWITLRYVKEKQVWKAERSWNWLRIVSNSWYSIGPCIFVIQLIVSQSVSRNCRLTHLTYSKRFMFKTQLKHLIACPKVFVFFYLSGGRPVAFPTPFPINQWWCSSRYSKGYVMFPAEGTSLSSARLYEWLWY